MIRITDIKLNLDDSYPIEKELESLYKLIEKDYRIPKQTILGFSIYKKAIDARKKPLIFVVYSIDLSLKDETKYLKFKNISIAPDLRYHPAQSGDTPLKHRPVVVGFGPSGLFAALILAEAGYKPIVLERGLDVARRTEAIETFYQTGIFQKHATIQFGEGGAGTFSDGKLTTLTHDLRSRKVLETFIKHGADKEILYINKPHIGTDVLKPVTISIREEIIKLGGEVRFLSQVTDFEVIEDKLVSLSVSGEKIRTDVALFGIGHSARDTFELIYHKNMSITQKAFSMGVRIEHPQKLINESQYGSTYNHKALGSADYKLSYHSPSGRSAYTFCMCPGGYVMNSTSEDGGIVTNGMSESNRDGENANSALLIGITPEDYGSTHPLAGMYLQRGLEQKAFDVVGRSYYAPVQLVGDFLKDRNSTAFGAVKPTFRPGTVFKEMKDILPEYMINTMKEALIDFDRKIKGFAMNDAILTGIETRSSSPIRMNRDELGESSIKGIYPMGEGAGFAGGIMSAAIDGIKQAEKVIEKYQLPKEV